MLYQVCISVKHFHYLFPLDQYKWIYVYNRCQKLDDGGHFVVTETLKKFIAGVKLFTYSNSGLGVVVQVYRSVSGRKKLN